MEIFLVLLFLGIVGVLVLKGFRKFAQSSGAENLVYDGIQFLDDGFEIPNPLAIGKRKVSYDDVTAVEVWPWYKVLLPLPLLRYGLAFYSYKSRLVGEWLAITIRGRIADETIFITPKDARGVADELKRRMQSNTKPEAVK